MTGLFLCVACLLHAFHAEKGQFSFFFSMASSLTYMYCLGLAAWDGRISLYWGPSAIPASFSVPSKLLPSASSWFTAPCSKHTIMFACLIHATYLHLLFHLPATFSTIHTRLIATCTWQTCLPVLCMHYYCLYAYALCSGRRNGIRACARHPPQHADQLSGGRGIISVVSRFYLFNRLSAPYHYLFLYPSPCQRYGVHRHTCTQPL